MRGGGYDEMVLLQLPLETGMRRLAGKTMYGSINQQTGHNSDTYIPQQSKASKVNYYALSSIHARLGCYNVATAAAAALCEDGYYCDG